VVVGVPQVGTAGLDHEPWVTADGRERAHRGVHATGRRRGSAPEPGLGLLDRALAACHACQSRKTPSACGACLLTGVTAGIPAGRRAVVGAVVRVVVAIG